MRVTIPYNFGDVVYCKNDEEQKECSIVEFKVLPNNILKLIVSYCGELCEVYEFEVSTEKDLLKSSNFGERE